MISQWRISVVEAECRRTRLHPNVKKTEYMAFNENRQGPLMASNGDPLTQAKDFKYLRSRMERTERDIKERQISV